MGVNIFLDTLGWDAFANGGMKQIFRDNERFPKVWLGTDPDYPEFRPSDFATWRTSIRELGCNVDMWMRGLDALEHDSALTFSVSY
jgi:hypothetical protein